MKNIEIIEGKPVAFEYSKTGMLNTVRFDDIIIDVTKMTKENIENWTGYPIEYLPLNGQFWLEIFVDCDSYTSQSERTRSVDSFHGHNFNLDEAIYSLI